MVRRSATWFRLGALALSFLAVHAARHVRTGELANLLWLSNVATLVLAVSCWLERPRWLGVAALWLSLSALLWTVDVSARPIPIDSALLTHLGSFGIALAAVRRAGLARGSWLRAACGLIILVGLSRFVTDARQNVNLAFAVADGWRGRFPSHVAYLALLFVLACALFFVLERLIAWLLQRAPQSVRPLAS